MIAKPFDLIEAVRAVREEGDKPLDVQRVAWNRYAWNPDADVGYQRYTRGMMTLYRWPRVRAVLKFLRVI